MTAPVLRASGAEVAGSNDGTTYNVPKPAGTASGDLIIISASAGDSCVFTTPSGFTILNDASTGGIFNGGSITFWKIAGGSEPSSYGLVANPISGHGGRQFRAWATSYTGADTTTPIASSTHTSEQASVTTIVLPSLTAPGVDYLYVGFAVESEGHTAAISVSGTLTNIAADSAVPAYAAGYKATTGSGSVSDTMTSATSAYFIAQAFLIAPAGSSGPILTAPVGTATAPTTATVGATTDTASGTMYVVVSPSATAPSVAQIQAGHDSTGSAPVGGYASSQSITSIGAKTFSATGLTASALYYAYVQQVNGTSANSAVLSVPFFITPSGVGYPTAITSGAAVSLPFGSSANVPVPPTVAGNLMILTAMIGSCTSPSLTPPSGWTLLTNSEAPTSFTSGIYQYWKISSGSEPASYPFTQGGSTNLGQALIQTWQGNDTTTPIGPVAASSAQTGTTSISGPSITTTNANSTYVMTALEYNGRTPTITPTAPLVGRAGTTAAGLVFEVADKPAVTAGAFTGAMTSNITGDFYGLSMAINPLAPSGPTLTAPVGTATGSTTATVGATTNTGSGTMYEVVSTSATPPTVSQIQAGHDSTGSAPVNGYAASQSITSTGAKTFAATGLAASTTYYSYTQQDDGSGNHSTVVSSASFTTSAPTYKVTTQPFENNSGSTGLLPLTNIPKVWFIDTTNDTIALTVTNVVTDSLGVLTVTNAAFVNGRVYAVAATDGTFANMGIGAYAAGP